MKQILENLPDEILSLKRFVATRKDKPKAPIKSGWQKPENQSRYSDIKGTCGFVAATEAKGGLIFYDFDHCFNEAGEFVNEKVKKWYQFLHAEGTFCERSQSKGGLHMFAKPTHDLPKPAGELKIDCGDGAVIEVFYCTTKFCLVTGDCYDCSPKAPIITGERADNGFQAVVNSIENQKRNETEKNNRTQEKESSAAKSAEKMPKEIQELIDRINAITPEELESKGYLKHSENGDPRPNGYCCIWCGSGEHDNKSGALSYYTGANGGYFSCHAKHCGGSVLNFLSKVYGIDNRGKEFFALLKKAAEDFEIDYDPKIFELPARAERLRRIEELYKQPQSPERDKAICNIIRGLCEWSRDNNGRPTNIKSSAANYELIFTYDPCLRNLFGRDNFRQEIIFKRRAIWHAPDEPLKDSWDDSDDSELRIYLALTYKEIGTMQRTFDFVNKFGRKNAFHGIKNFFNGLPKWDGTARMETIFCKFLGAKDTPYTRAVTKNFMLGAIARAFYPGCDYQSSLVLQGPQGIGKSRVLRMLGGKHGVNPRGESWHVALRDSIDDSHAVDTMRKGWLIELEEFAATSRADVNAMKGVLSADDVTRRFAYDRRAKTVKAHWVFVGTTNDDSPLRDQTGNRRFLPIKCHNKESTIIEGMTADYIRQCWAEAYHVFRSMFPTVDSFDADKLRLPVDIQKHAADKAAGITQDDGLITEIKGFVNSPILPDYIWLSLSKEERRKFFADGGKFSSKIMYSDLIARRQKRGGTKEAIAADVAKIKDFLNEDNQWVIVETVPRGKDNPPDLIYHIYGTEQRKHICAGEIFNECWNVDNRKRINRITEALSRLEGWKAGNRLINADPYYPDQKKPYYREDTATATIDSNSVANSAGKLPFDPDDLPI